MRGRGDSQNTDNSLLVRSHIGWDERLEYIVIVVISR